MTIGEALKQIRGELCLTQKQMCAGVVTRSFYAKVEGGKNKISADKLAEILFEHDVDINYFYQMLRETYMPKSKQIDEELNQRMNQAFNSGKLELVEQCYQDILVQSNSKILRLNSMITVANLKNELNFIDPKVKQELFSEFSKEQNWMINHNSLRLFTNTMPLWSQENLSFFVGRLLSRIEKDKHITELNQERYLRILENYLTICYQRQAQKEPITAKNIKKAFDYINELTPTVHFLIYKIAALYLKDLLFGYKDDARIIKNELKKYGYQDIVKNWPE